MSVPKEFKTMPTTDDGKEGKKGSFLFFSRKGSKGKNQPTQAEAPPQEANVPVGLFSSRARQPSEGNESSKGKAAGQNIVDDLLIEGVQLQRFR